MRLPKKIIKALSKLKWASVAEDDIEKYIAIVPLKHCGWNDDERDLVNAVIAIHELIAWSKEKINEQE